MNAKILTRILFILIISTVGVFLSIVGGSWDITSHLLQKPETFFTPSHGVLYSGIGLSVLAAFVGLVWLLKYSDLKSKSLSIALKLLILGSSLELIGGPTDFVWHGFFGVDGLLSPPHIMVEVGIFVNAIGTTLGLCRAIIQIPSKKRLIKSVLIPAFASLWFSSTWLVFFFVLPISKGVHFDFNMNPVLALFLAIVSLPLLSSIIFLTASKIIGRFGGASAVAIVVVLTNTLTNIMPSEQLSSLLPLYLPFVIFPAIIADVILHKSINRQKMAYIKYRMLFAGAIIGSIFFFMGYPMLVMTFEAVHLTSYSYAVYLIPLDFLKTDLSVLVFVIMLGASIGCVGALISYKKIKFSEQEHQDNSSLSGLKIK